MDVFLDTACSQDVKSAMTTGLIDGITTNPSLLAHQGTPPLITLERLCDLNVGPVSMEVTQDHAESMVMQALTFSAISPLVVIKVPLTREGLKACRLLRERNIAVNVTLCFSLVQALLAAKAGATYISPFVGRLDDTGVSGIDLLRDIRHLYERSSFPTKILAASLRNPHHVHQACAAGAHIVTLPPRVFDQLYIHPLTERGLEIFHQDWRSLAQNSL